MRRDVEMGAEAGFFRYLTKPIKIDLFMEALDAALELRKAKPGPRRRKLKGAQKVQTPSSLPE